MKLNCFDDTRIAVAINLNISFLSYLGCYSKHLNSCDKYDLFNHRIMAVL